MMAVAHALEEVRYGWRALQAGFSGAAAVHVECARTHLARVGGLTEGALAKAWRLTEQLADAVKAAPGIPDGPSANCTCVDNRDGRHRHGPAGCLVVGCDCKSTT